jgi:phage antirepressor YoqD-like protein
VLKVLKGHKESQELQVHKEPLVHKEPKVLKVDKVLKERLVHKVL